MCGRYTHLFTWKELHTLMRLLSPEIPIAARYNVAPTQSAPVIVRDRTFSGAALTFMRWGLIPHWAKDESIASSLINARSETIDTKPAFRDAFRHHRCLVPISGFYEWQSVPGQKHKQPQYITPTDEQPWLLAGVCSSWHPPGSEELKTFSILTTAANSLMSKFHDRMPVILEPDQARTWIGTEDAPVPEPETLKSLLRPYPSELMLSRPVSRAVNSPKLDEPRCIETVEPPSGLFGPDF